MILTHGQTVTYCVSDEFQMNEEFEVVSTNSGETVGVHTQWRAFLRTVSFSYLNRADNGAWFDLLLFPEGEGPFDRAYPLAGLRRVEYKKGDELLEEHTPQCPCGTCERVKRRVQAVLLEERVRRATTGAVRVGPANGIELLIAAGELIG